MLAVQYRESLVRYPCFVQPKLDGFRAYYLDGYLHSRNGHRWAEAMFAHIMAPLRKVVPSGVILDGELYRHGWPFERIAEALSLFRRRPTEDLMELRFYVFDSPSTLPYEERAAYCQKLVTRGRFSHIQVVRWAEVGCRDQADQWHEAYLTAGFEGTIYRQSGCGYQCGRSRRLLKRKEREKSAECARRFREE